MAICGAGDLAFLLLPASKVDDDLLNHCAELFSNHYGVWGPKAGGQVKPGGRVKMSAKRLRNQCLPDNKRCYVVAAIQPVTDQVIAHAFYTRFYYAPGQGAKYFHSFPLHDQKYIVEYVQWTRIQQISYHYTRS